MIQFYIQRITQILHFIFVQIDGYSHELRQPPAVVQRQPPAVVQRRAVGVVQRRAVGVVQRRAVGVVQRRQRLCVQRLCGRSSAG